MKLLLSVLTALLQRNHEPIVAATVTNVSIDEQVSFDDAVLAKVVAIRARRLFLTR